MILYKYFNSQNGEKFLRQPFINFTPSKFFNDPFEVTPTYPWPTDVERILQRKKHSDEFYRKNYHILCLTRSPLNKLMWAHYADSHKGIVVGIDVSQSVFTNKNTCTIPVQFGNVIYTSTKPQTGTIEASPPTYVFRKYDLKYAELLNRLFLYKSIDWAYEEEIRVVKYFGEDGLHPGIDDEGLIEQQNCFKITEKEESKRFELRIADDSIQEIYFGLNNSYKDLYAFTKEKYSRSELFKCAIDPFTWSLMRKSIK